MKREEQIKQASQNLKIFASRADIGTFAKEVFEAGAKWADENPKSTWISVNERLPEEGTDIFEAYTLMVEYQGIRDESEKIVMSKHYNGEFIGNGKIRQLMGGTTCSTTHHWMPIPELPKEELL